MNKTKKNHLTDPGITGKRLILVYILAAAVALFTVISLILPAIALTRKEKVLNCTYQVYTHDDSCYTEIIQEDGTKEKILTCGKADYVVHVHTDDCYQDGVLVCNLPEIEGHKHTSACWKTEQVLVCGLEEDDDHTHDDSCYEEQEVLVCGKQEMPHIHDDSCYNEDGELTCGMLQVEEHVHGKECMEEVETAGEMETSTGENAVEDETSVITREDGIHDQETVEQEDAQQDTEDTKDIAGIENTGKAEDSDLSDIYKNGENPKEEKKPVQSFTAKAGRVEIVVKADQGAFPAGTTMKVKSVKNKKIVNALSDAVSGEVEGVEAVDITFSDADGTEIEPEIPVQVTLTSSRNMDNAEPVVVHMDDEGNTEIVKQEKAADAADSSKDDEKNQVVFEADSFSVYALVYTVDFSYSVDDQVHEYNLPGGGFITLSDLAEVLDIIRDTSFKTVEEFVAEVENVKFSDDSLVQVIKVEDKAKTVGQLKDELGLEIAYSTELSRKEIEKLDAQSVKGVDWVLFAMQPFISEETLTITMKNGDVIAVAVTDAQYTDNLSLLFNGLTIKKNGEVCDLASPIIVREGDSFVIDLAFAEHDEFQFMNDDTKMYYEMPQQFRMSEGFETTTDVSITVGGKVHILKNNKVTYDPDSHRVYLQWNTTDPEFSYLIQSGDANVEFSVTGTFDNSKIQEVTFSDSVTVETAPPANAGVEKKGTYDASSHIITYTLSVRAEGDVTGDITLTDAFIGGGDSALSYVNGSVKVNWNEGSARTEADTEVIKDSWTKASDGNSFTITIPQDKSSRTSLLNGEVCVIEYQAEVDMTRLNLSTDTAYDEAGDPIQQVFDDTGNTVTLTNPANKYDELSDNVSTWVQPIQFSDMHKESNLGPATNGTDAQGNEIRYRDITWTITTNTTGESSLGGSSITDTLTWNPEFITMKLQPQTGNGAGILVQRYKRQEGDTDQATFAVGEPEYIPWSALHIQRDSDEEADGTLLSTLTWTWNVPDDPSESYKYVITYVTRADMADVKVGSTVFNDVYGKGGHDDAEETIWPVGIGDNISVDKKVVSNSLSDIEWNIDVLAAATAYNDYFRVTDTIPSQWVTNPETGVGERLKDRLPGLEYGVVYEQSDPKIAEVMSVTGLQEGETWTAEWVSGGPYAADKLLIRFYKDVEGEIVEGLKEYTGSDIHKVSLTHEDGTTRQHDRRLINIRLKTANDETWVDWATRNMATKAWQAYHENKVQARGDTGHYDFDSAQAPIVKPTLVKSLSYGANEAAQYTTVRQRISGAVDEGTDYPAYRFLVSVGGIRDDNNTIHNDNDGKGDYILVEDTFDTEKWKLFKSADYNSNWYSWMDDHAFYAALPGYPESSKGAVLIEQGHTCTETKQGVQFRIYNPPKKDDGSYHNFYTFLYWLIPKDKAAMEAVIADTLKEENKQVLAHVTKGVATYNNIAALILKEGDPIKDDEDYVYEYNPTSKTVSYDGVNRIAAYTVVLNAQKADLVPDTEESQMLEMTDEHSANLSVDYSSIRIYIDEETDPDTQNRVTYDYSGNVGTFKIPDKTKVTITYEAKLIAASGTTANFENTVTLNGFKTTVSETKKISSESTSSAGVYQLNLFKYSNGNMQSGLAGATFRLLDANKRPILDRDGREITFTTEDNGYATITLHEHEQGVSLKKNTTYYLQELKAPVEEKDGNVTYYRQDPTYYSFLISDNPNYSAPGGVYVYSNGDILKVRNFEDKGGLNISKSFAGNVTLTDEQKQQITFRVEKKTASGAWALVREIPYTDFTYSDYEDQNGKRITGTYHYAMDGLNVGDVYRVIERNANINDEDVTHVTEYLVDGSDSDNGQFTIVPSDIAEKNKSSHNVIVTNTYYKPSYTFTKRDAESGASLKGAVFSVYQNGETVPIRTYTTDSDGSFEITEKDENASYKTGILYYAVETEAPDGYVMPEKPEKYYFYFGGEPELPKGVNAVNLKEDYGTVTVADEKQHVDVPVMKTWGKTGSQVWPMAVQYIKLGLYQKEAGSSSDPLPVLVNEEAVTLTLTAEDVIEGQKYGKLDEAFTNLPAASDGGKLLEYSVKELAVSFDGENEVDPTDSFTVAYSDVALGEGDEAVTYKAVNNTDKGTTLSVEKVWYSKDEKGNTALIENPQGEEYSRTFNIYRTATKQTISSQLDSVSIDTGTNGKKMNLAFDGFEKVTPGDTLLLTITPDYNDAEFSMQYTPKYDNDDNEYWGWKDFVPKISFNCGRAGETKTFIFTVPTEVLKSKTKQVKNESGGYDNVELENQEDAYTILRSLHLCNYNTPNVENLGTVVISKLKSGSTLSGQISAATNHAAVDGKELVTSFDLSSKDGWTYASDLLDKYNEEGEEYTYWVEEEEDDDSTIYNYRDGVVTVTNFMEMTEFEITKNWYDNNGNQIKDREALAAMKPVLVDLYRTTDDIEGTRNARYYNLRYRSATSEIADTVVSIDGKKLKASMIDQSYLKDGVEIRDGGQIKYSDFKDYQEVEDSSVYTEDGRTAVTLANALYCQAGDMLHITVTSRNPLHQYLVQTSNWADRNTSYYSLNFHVFNKNSWSDKDDTAYTYMNPNTNPAKMNLFWMTSPTVEYDYVLKESDLPSSGDPTFYLSTYSGFPVTAKIEVIEGNSSFSQDQIQDIVQNASPVIEEIQLNSGNCWRFTENLPKYDSAGRTYHYFAVEHPLPGYTPAYIIGDLKTEIQNKEQKDPDPTGSLKIKKIAGGMPESYADKKYYFMLSRDGYYYNQTGEYGIEPVEFEITNGQELQFENLPVGSYMVTEILKGEHGAEIPNYRLKSELIVNENVSDNNTVTVSEGSTTNATIKNTYEQGVDQTTLKVKKNWNPAPVGEASATFVLKRFMNDGITPDEISWDEVLYTAVLDGETDEREQSAWEYTWPQVDKVYWDYNAGKYVDYVYKIEETSVTFGGVTTDLTNGSDVWNVLTEEIDDGWEVTNNRNSLAVSLTKQWQDPKGEVREWPKNGDDYLPISVTAAKTLNVPGLGIRPSTEKVTFKLVPNDNELKELNASTGCTITAEEKSAGTYVFAIDGLKKTGKMTISGQEVSGIWVYNFIESQMEGFDAPMYGLRVNDNVDSELASTGNGGKIVNRQQSVTAALEVTKAVTLADGVTPYNKTWPSEGFTFTLTQDSEEPGVRMPAETTATARDDSEEAKTARFQDLTFSAAGTYLFKIKEQNTQVENYAYDDLEHIVTVNVFEENGQLVVKEIKYDDADSLTVTNKYVKPGEVLFRVKKTFAGGQFSDAEPFNFTLTQVENENNDKAVVGGIEKTITTLGESGNMAELSFEPVTLSNGEYWFMIGETPGSNPNIRYDSRKYWVKVVVNPDGTITKGGKLYDPTSIDAAFTNIQLVSKTASKKWVEADGVTPFTPESGTTIILQLTQWKKDSTQVTDFKVEPVVLDGVKDNDAVFLKETGGSDNETTYTGQEYENWTYTWNNLPKVYEDPGHPGVYLEYEYQVIETKVGESDVENGITKDGRYLVDVDGLNIVNRKNETSVEFGKQWRDEDGEPTDWITTGETDEPYAPISLTLQRENDSTYSKPLQLKPGISSVTIDETNHTVSWKLPQEGDTRKIYWFTIDGLERYKEDGSEWKYFVTENELNIGEEKWFTSYSKQGDKAGEQEYIVNRHSTTKLKITKEWYDANGNPLKTWPEGRTLTLHLYRSGTEAPILTLSGIAPKWEAKDRKVENNNITATFTETDPFTFELEGLPTGNNGTVYEYYITEEQVPGYAPPIYGNSGEFNTRTNAAYHKGVIKNTMPTTEFTFTKVWREKDGGNAVPWPKDESQKDIPITVRIKTDGEETSYEAMLNSKGCVNQESGNPITWMVIDNDLYTTFKVSGLPLWGKGDKELVYTVVETACSGYSASYAMVEETRDEETATNESKILPLIDAIEASDGQYIINTPQDGYELPSTGGRGTKAIYLLGIFLTISAGALLLMKKKQLV